MRFELDGGPRRVDLGGGYALRAPGLRGRGNIEAARAAGTRGPELATVSFDDALSSASMDEVRNIELEVAPAPVSASELRGPTGEAALELDVPDLGPETGQVVLSVDETGALRWHFPLEDDQSIQPAVTRGAGGVKTFRIPRAVAQVPPDDRKSDRGLVGILGRKILKVLVYPIADAVLGPITDTFVSRWEKRNRPYVVRRFGPTDRGELTPEDWSRLGKGRALLFVHGTFSSSNSAFSALPPNVHDELNKRFDGRLFAFDHPTVSVDPDTNVRWLLEQIAPDVSLDVDLITHSRGGLVGRCLVEQTHASQGSEFMRVRRVVLVGVPNAGTALADPDHMVDLIDRTTTMLNLFPDAFITDALEGVLAVVKVVGHAGLVHLDGLASMCPGGPLLNRLRQPFPDPPEYLSIAADFEPAASGLASYLGQTVADKFIDRVFGSEQNDLVVPTAGVCDLYDSPGTPIPEERRLQILGQQGISHTAYFYQPQTADRLLTWLTCMESSDLSLLEELLEQTNLDGVNGVLARRAGEIDDQLVIDLRQLAYGSLESGRVDEALSLITVGVLAARAAGDGIGELDSLLARGRIASSEPGRPELIEVAEESFRSGRDLSASLIGNPQPRAIGLYFDFTAELAGACATQGRLEVARSLWSEARERLHGDPMLEFGAAYNLAMVCHDLRDIEAAGRYALMMTSLYDPDGFRKARPDSEMMPPSQVCAVLYGIGRALRGAQDLETAARLFSAIIEIDREFRDARFQLGFCQMFGADVHAAVETWKEISEDDPGNADALANYAQSLGAVGRLDEALSTIDAALELKHDHRLRMLRGGFLQSLGRHTEAAEDFESFLATGDDEVPGSILQARISRARSLKQAGDIDGAIDEAQRMADQENEEAHWLGLTMLADLQTSSGDTDQAIKTYNEVVDADPQDLSVRLARLDVLILARGPEAYLDELRYVARRDRDPKAALARIEELLISHPQDRELRKLRAYANLQAVEPDLAEEELTQLLADTPNDGEALHWRGIARLTSRYEPDGAGWNEGLSEERIQGALSDLAGAVRNAPDNQDYRNALLWLVDRALGHPWWRLSIGLMAPREDGLAMVMPGLSDALVLGTVASGLSADRRWSEAVTTLREAQDKLRALGLEVSAQRIHYQLADNRLRLYQLQQAMDELERAHDTLWMYARPLTPFLAERWEQLRADRESRRAETVAGWELEYLGVLARLFNPGDLFVADVIKADALNRIGRDREAVAVLEEVRDKLEDVAKTLSLGVSIQTFFSVVWIYRDSGELARANELLQRLKPFVESDHDRGVLLGVEASLLERECRLEEAFVKYREVQPIASELGQGLPFINALQLAGNCCEREAFGDAMEVLIGADIDAAQSDNDLFGYHITWARALHGLDRAGEALSEIRAALAIVEDLRSHFTLYESRTSWLGRRQRFFDIAVRIAADADAPTEAFLLAEKAQARTFLDQLVDVEMAAPGSAHPLQSTLQNANALREVLTELLDTVVHHGCEFVDFERLKRLQALDSTITVVDTAAAESTLTLSADKLRDELRKVETAKENLERRIEGETLAEIQSSEGTVASFDEVRALLESEEKSIGGGRRLVLAAYYVMGDSTLLFLLRSDFSAPRLCWLEFGVRRLIDHAEVLQAALDKEHPQFGDSFDQLFSSVVEPILGVALEHDVIWIVPHRALHYFPLHLVRTSQFYLGERNPIFYSPSASVLPQILSRRRPRTQRAIVLGDPESNLPFAREEANTVAELLGTTPLLGAQATKENLMSELDAGGSFDVVHLACHGYFDYDHPMESGIVLASGDGASEPVYLTAGEFSRLRMSASLVALSACETGQNFQREGDELVGLTRALFRAGAASLLVSSWEISDVATNLLLCRFYQLQGDGQGPESPLLKCDALRAAQRFVRDLTAADMIEHCNERLGSLSEAGDEHIAIQIGMAIADAQIVADDLEAATESYDALAARASTPDPSFAKLRERIDSARKYLSARREQGGLPKSDYSVKPLDEPYFWGGFVLQGDWR